LSNPAKINPEILQREREAIRRSSLGRNRRGRFAEPSDRMSRADVKSFSVKISCLQLPSSSQGWAVMQQ
jgi:hypothetical protein